jgi:hypothetical protein
LVLGSGVADVESLLEAPDETLVRIDFIRLENPQYEFNTKPTSLTIPVGYAKCLSASAVGGKVLCPATEEMVAAASASNERVVGDIVTMCRLKGKLGENYVMGS